MLRLLWVEQHWTMRENTSCSGWLCVHAFRSRCDLFKQLKVHKPVGSDGLPGRVLRACADNCIHWHFQPLPDPVCKTYIFQADHHSPCAQEHHGNLFKLSSPRSTHICSYEIIWKSGHDTHQHHYPRNTRPTPICIPPQQIHRWCNLYCTPHWPFPPGQKEHLRKNVVHWLQLSVQHHSALQDSR